MTLQTIDALAQHESGNGNASPTQQVLPGTHAPFDVAAALDSIEAYEVAASIAERAYTVVSDHAKQLRKAADAANAKLRDLIRALNERRHAERYEATQAIDSPAPPEDPSLLGESDAPTSEVETDSAAAAVDISIAQLGQPRGVKARGRRREQ